MLARETGDRPRPARADAAAASNHGGLALRRVALCRLDLLAELGDHILVDERVQVEAEHVQQPPVAQRALLADNLDGVLGHHAVLHVDQAGAHAGHEDHDEAKQQHHRQHGGQDDVPEPDEDEGLLVDDVERQHAERVVARHSSGGTELVEHALGQPREHVYLPGREHVRAGNTYTCRDGSMLEPGTRIPAGTGAC